MAERSRSRYCAWLIHLYIASGAVAALVTLASAYGLLPDQRQASRSLFAAFPRI
jgi:hypothetical protein